MQSNIRPQHAILLVVPQSIPVGFSYNRGGGVGGSGAVGSTSSVRRSHRQGFPLTIHSSNVLTKIRVLGDITTSSVFLKVLLLERFLQHSAKIVRGTDSHVGRPAPKK